MDELASVNIAHHCHDMDVRDHTSIVRESVDPVVWFLHIGADGIEASVTIKHCPWCGVQLMEAPQDRPTAKARRAMAQAGAKRVPKKSFLEKWEPIIKGMKLR